MIARQIQSTSSQDLDHGFLLIQQTAKRLSESLVFGEVLDEVVTFLAALLKPHSCRVYLFEGDELILRAAAGSPAGAVERQITATADSTWSTQDRKPFAISERAYEDARFKVFTTLPGDCFEAFLSVPVIGGGKLLGLINVQSVTPYKYCEREIKMIETISALFGTRIEIERLQRDKALLSDRIETRTLIERAKRILQKDLKISEQDAYRTMRLQSQNRNKRMKEIAQALILRDEVRQLSSQHALNDSGIKKTLTSKFFSKSNYRDPKLELDSTA